MESELGVVVGLESSLDLLEFDVFFFHLLVDFFCISLECAIFGRNQMVLLSLVNCVYKFIDNLKLDFLKHEVRIRN